MTNGEPMPMPVNVEAEQIVLGSILMRNDVLGHVSSEISAGQFAEPVHQAIYAEIARQVAAGKTVTPVTLKDSFPDLAIAKGVTVSQYLARLAAEAMPASTARSYAVIVRELAVMREMIAIGDDLRSARNAGHAPSEAVTLAWDKLDDLRMQAAPQSGERGSIASLVRRAQAERAESKEPARVVSTGLHDLDRELGGGWRSKRLYVFAGRPGMGKSVFALSTARKVAARGTGVAIFSLELDGDEIRARLTADVMSRGFNPISYSSIVSGNLSDDELESVCHGEDELAELPIEVDASAGISMMDIEARARMARDRFARQGIGLGLIVIDYLGLVRRGDRYRGNKVDELGEIALAAKQTAKRLDAAVLLLAQLNRQVESREDKRPTMADLRASGEIEEHADVVGLLYRHAYYAHQSAASRSGNPDGSGSDDPTQYDLDVILGKNRLGPTKTVELWCNPAWCAVSDKARG